MTLPRRIALNACDNCIYGHHRLVADRQRGGNIAFMMVELAGRVEPGVVREALAKAMLAHPVTMSALRTSAWRLRPFWELPVCTMERATAAAEQAYCHEDLRSASDWAERLERACVERYSPDWVFSQGPQVRLEQYDLPGERTRLCLRWPHFLMDAEGAQWFLAKLELQRTGHGDPNSPLLRDDQTVNVLADASAVKRFSLMTNGLSHHQAPPRSMIRHLEYSDPDRFDSYQMLHRLWEGAEFERIRENAKRTTPPGTALYSRHAASAVVRALDRIYREERIKTGAYLLTFPMRVRRLKESDETGFRRPLIGNYLVTPTLCIRREDASDVEKLGASILGQVQAFLARRGDAAQWAMLEAASLVHTWTYSSVFGFLFARESYSSGFSYYAEISPALRKFADAEVVNIWGGGPTTTPPGWNPVFSRYGDRLNMSLTWTRPAIKDDLAARYASYIEEQLFESP